MIKLWAPVGTLAVALAVIPPEAPAETRVGAPMVRDEFTALIY